MSHSITQEKFQRQTSFLMLARKWQLPGSDISNTVVKELKFSILQTGYQQNPGTQVNYEKPQEIGSNCHKEPALTFLSKVVSAFRYHQRRHGLYADALLVQLPHALQTINNYTQKATDSLNKATPLLFQGVGRPFVRQPIQYAGVPYP